MLNKNNSHLESKGNLNENDLHLQRLKRVCGGQGVRLRPAEEGNRGVFLNNIDLLC